MLTDCEILSTDMNHVGHRSVDDLPGSSRTSPRILAVVVDYRKGRRAVIGIQSLLKQYPRTSLHVVVVENSEEPENTRNLCCLADIPGIEIRIQDRNIGYTKGCNLGASVQQSDYILLQNPDIVWEQDGALQQLIAYMEDHPEVAIAGPGQVNDDGSRPDIARRFPTVVSQLARRLPGRAPSWAVCSHNNSEPEGSQQTEAILVDWLQSSCIVVRREFWELVGGLDERYFLFMADPDLARTASENGQRVMLLPDVLVRADGRRASGGGLWRILITPAGRWHTLDALRYYWKWGFFRTVLKPR